MFPAERSKMQKGGRISRRVINIAFERRGCWIEREVYLFIQLTWSTGNEFACLGITMKGFSTSTNAGVASFSLALFSYRISSLSVVPPLYASSFAILPIALGSTSFLWLFVYSGSRLPSECLRKCARNAIAGYKRGVGRDRDAVGRSLEGVDFLLVGVVFFHWISVCKSMHRCIVNK